MIILASTSRYRKAQLESLGLRFECINPEVDENPVKLEDLSLREKAENLSLLKAQAVQKKYPDAIIIAGDQIAALGERLLSKPGSVAANIEQLLSLSGREHQLITSNVILTGSEVKLHTEIARLQMKTLSREKIEKYVAFANPIDCAGGYKIELGGTALFESIVVNDFTSIQGMNLNFIGRELSQFCWQK
jgi:septum formation protein